MNFKKFLVEECENPDMVKWDVVLFFGDYSPITKKEYDRIDQFVETVIKNPQWVARFADRVDIGLVADVSHKEDHLELEANYQLTFDEKNFITSKLFGLKMINADITNLYETAKIPAREEEFVKTAREVVDKLYSKFHKANILLVLRPSDRDNIKEFMKITPYLQDENIKVGFVVFHEENDFDMSYLRGIPCNADTLKIITLLNADRPDPEELRGFASKYRIHNRINDIRKIHFKTGGDNYYLAFEQFFPDLKIYDVEDHESTKANYEVVLDMLKEMYLKFVQ